MSSSKKDRSVAPRTGTRPSRAKHVDDRNVAPPSGYRRAGKPKPGERAMEAQLAGRPAPADRDSCDCGHAYSCHQDDDACSECECRAWSPRDAGPSVSVLWPEQTSSPARDPVEGTTTSDALQSGERKPREHLSLSEDVVPPADPWWTPEREEAFQMALQGIPQHQVAKTLDRDRHTIARWMEDERFETRLYDENMSRFRASRQRRSMQTVRLTDKAEKLAGRMLDQAIELADKGKDNLAVRLAARDWLQEFRENSRREDEIYGLDKQRVDVNVHGAVEHRHKGKVVVSFKTFLSESLQKLGVDPEAEEVDAGRADEVLVAVTERALSEGSFLDDLVERERADKLAPLLAERT